MNTKWTIEQRGETIGVFESDRKARVYAARVLGLPASVDVDHGDHVCTYLYADRASLEKDDQGCYPEAVVLPCDPDHIPDYRA